MNWALIRTVFFLGLLGSAAVTPLSGFFGSLVAFFEQCAKTQRMFLETLGIRCALLVLRMFSPTRQALAIASWPRKRREVK